MDPRKQAVAAACLKGAEENTLSFPEIVGTLMAEGFESYLVDFRRARASYYLPDGESFELATHQVEGPIAPAFHAGALQAAIREAQQQVPGYTYRGFCAKAAAAGCAFYIVSFPGRRALYVGRTGETHVERFPD
ncbi:DUF1398 family protein [Starkeya koreensis]|uniref:DUF1398 family protein n=1 Tax=Ancylobacter koreensis TaxID=266121 RepID=A0ABT0DNA1_9HYPH|nr:DUF1398 family protein [Ancylobacter koreensis]MCK0208767.1 DUF1398 family protein [Ancylobacter koreensis]